MRKFKRIFITGITGSGGSYLAEYIYKKNKKIKIYGSYRSTGYKTTIEKELGLFNKILKDPHQLGLKYHLYMLLYLSSGKRQDIRIRQSFLIC